MLWLILAQAAPPGFPLPFSELTGEHAAIVILAVMWWLDRQERIKAQDAKAKMEQEAREVGQKALDAIMARDSQRRGDS